MVEWYKKHLDQFIGTMEMPCYDDVSNFYYYDVLEALSRHLFQCMIDYEREKYVKDEFSDSESSDSGSASSSSQRKPTKE